jgi:hypothetical protein
MNRRRKDKSQENRIKNQTNETQLINKEIVDVEKGKLGLEFSILIHVYSLWTNKKMD